MAGGRYKTDPNPEFGNLPGLHKMYINQKLLIAPSLPSKAPQTKLTLGLVNSVVFTSIIY